MRFPLAGAVTVFIALIGMFFVHQTHDEALTKVFVTLLLGLPLFVSQTLWSEKKKFSPSQKSILRIGVLAFLVIYYLLLPDSILQAPFSFFFRTGLWMGGFLLLLTFVPFLDTHSPSIRTFWEYNKHLFIIFIQSIFFAGVTFAGISAGLWATETLFDLSIDGERYGEIWVLCASLLAPWLFLYDLPRSPEKQPQTPYGKALIILTQYILIPLVILYFLILYTYTAKILLTQDWPQGVVASMIIGFSFVGILTHTISWPRLSEVKWIFKFVQYFYTFLIPQTVLLFVAIGIRIGQYGITEKRYLVVLFGLWLLGLAIFFLFNRKKDIRIVPLSLFVLILMSSFGPWGAFDIAQKSQTHRWKTLLEKNQMLVDGKAVPTTDEIFFEDRKEISATARYLYRYHGEKALQSFFEKDIHSFGESLNERTQETYFNAYDVPQNLVESLGIDYLTRWEARQVEREDEYFHWSLDHTGLYPLEGFDYLLSIHSQYPEKEPPREIFIQEEKYQIQLNALDQTLIIQKGDETLGSFSLKKYFEDFPDFDLSEKRSFSQGLKIPAPYTAFEAQNENLNLKIYFDRISGEKTKNTRRIDSFSGTMLLKFSNPTQE